MGLAAQRNQLLEDLLLAGTSGGFVYIATVGVLPLIATSTGGGVAQVALEVTAFAAGVGCMVAVANFEGHS